MVKPARPPTIVLTPVVPFTKIIPFYRYFRNDLQIMKDRRKKRLDPLLGLTT